MNDTATTIAVLTNATVRQAAHFDMHDMVHRHDSDTAHVQQWSTALRAEPAAKVVPSR